MTIPRMSSHHWNSAFTRGGSGGGRSGPSRAEVYGRSAGRSPPPAVMGRRPERLHSTTMIDITPDPIALQLRPAARSTGTGSATPSGCFVAYQVMVREARRRGLDSEIIINGLIVVADRRADRRPALPRHRPVGPVQGRPDHDPPAASGAGADGAYVFAGFTGLGVYGGLHHRDDRRAAPTSAGSASRSGAGRTSSRRPCSLMQAIGRFGNFFNQELYGPPTNLPWGIAIQCKNRVAASTPARRAPTRTRPWATTSTRCSCTSRCRAIVGLGLPALAGPTASRTGSGRATSCSSSSSGTGLTRFLLEFLRAGYNWTVGGIPTAQIFAGVGDRRRGERDPRRPPPPGRSERGRDRGGGGAPTAAARRPATTNQARGAGPTPGTGPAGDGDPAEDDGAAGRVPEARARRGGR